MATPRSRVLEMLDYYWNQHWSQDKRIKLIICGSSAAWIINKIINLNLKMFISHKSFALDSFNHTFTLLYSLLDSFCFISNLFNQHMI